MAVTAPLECLDIRPAPQPRYDAESLMRLPAFWTGALAARDANDVAARRALLAIRDAVADTPLAAIPAFETWLARSLGKGSVAG